MLGSGLLQLDSRTEREFSDEDPVCSVCGLGPSVGFRMLDSEIIRGKPRRRRRVRRVGKDA